MTQPDQLQLDKLPKWAQSFIADLLREREIAVRALNEYCDSTTESPFSVTELECTGEEQGPSFKTRYIQARRITVRWQGVELDVFTADDGIRLQWGSESGRGIGEVAMIPQSFQQIILKSPDNMRR